MEKKIKVFIETDSGKIETYRTTPEEIRKNINVVELTKQKTRFCLVKRILTQRTNYKGNFYSELHYHKTFEQWRSSRKRIERLNEAGYEDYTGYGCRTEGKKNRFYIGKSTGWLPIYLEILRKDSTGGGALFWKHGTLRPIN